MSEVLIVYGIQVAYDGDGAYREYAWVWETRVLTETLEDAERLFVHVEGEHGDESRIVKLGVVSYERATAEEWALVEKKLRLSDLAGIVEIRRGRRS